MLGLPNGAKIYFCSQPVDLRRGFDGLSGIVESVFAMNVLDGHLFLFANRKLIGSRRCGGKQAGWFNGTSGWSGEHSKCLAHPSGQAHVTIDATQLAMLLGGVPLASARARRKRMEAA